MTVSPRYYPEDAVQEMIAAEREACAKIIDDLVESDHDFDDNQWWIDDMLRNLAVKIRARSQQ